MKWGTQIEQEKSLKQVTNTLHHPLLNKGMKRHTSMYDHNTSSKHDINVIIIDHLSDTFHSRY